MISAFKKFISSMLRMTTPPPHGTGFPSQQKNVILYMEDILHELTISKEENCQLLSSYKVNKITHYKAMNSDPRHEFLVAAIVEQGDVLEQSTLILLRIERLKDRTNNVEAADTVDESSDSRLKEAIRVLFRSDSKPELKDATSEEDQEESELASQDASREPLPKLTIPAPTTSKSIISKISPTIRKPTFDSTSVSSISISASHHSNAKDVVVHIDRDPKLSKKDNLILRSFCPENLSLINLAILAKAVHDIDPLYSLFNHQCYWYSGTIIRVVQALGGVDVTHCVNPIHHTEDETEVEVRLRHTRPQEAGCWRIFPIHLIRDYVVHNALSTYIELCNIHDTKMQRVREKDARIEAERSEALLKERKVREKLEKALKENNEEKLQIQKVNEELASRLAQYEMSGQVASPSHHKQGQSSITVTA